MDELWRGIIAGDEIMPSQFYDGLRAGTEHDGNKMLWLAVLEDAVRCYIGVGAIAEGANHDKYKRRYRAEARCWFGICDCERLHPDEQWIVAFTAICDLFDIDPYDFRRALINRGRQIRLGRQRPRISGREMSIRDDRPSHRRMEA